MIVGWNVSLNGRQITKVFQRVEGTIKATAEEIRRGLINHDGYDPGIKVTKERKKRV
jgi:hypothetical protein